MSSDKVEVTEDILSITHSGEIKMEKYNSKNAYYPSNNNNIRYYEPDDPSLVGNVDYPHIIFNKEDGKCGMKVSLEEIVDVWLETLEPELQQTLELEEKTRSEMRELATLRKEKELREEDDKLREEDDKRTQVRGMLKPFLAEKIVDVLSKRDLDINKSNIRSLISECKELSGWNSPRYFYNPMGILFTEKEWDEFRGNCNNIIMNGNPKKWVGIYDDYESLVRWDMTTRLTELRDKPISFWK